MDWISIGGPADERRRSRQASLFFIDLNPKEDDGREGVGGDLADEGLEA